MADSGAYVSDRLVRVQQQQVPAQVWAAVAVLAVVVVVLAVAAVPPAFNSYALQNNYRNDRRAVHAANMDLLASILEKLAELTGNKEAQTGVAAFGVMSAAFGFMAKTRDLVQQRFTLCSNSTVVAAFGVSASIIQNHTASCQAYDVWIPLVGSYSDGNADASTYLSAFAALVVALVRLDNAISKDP